VAAINRLIGARTHESTIMNLTFLTSLAIGAVSVILASSATAQQLSGAGASFPAPLYQRWAVEYNKLHPDVQVNYQSVGSGAGVKQFVQGTVNFAASDAALSDEEIAKVKQGAVMIPATAGSIVIAYNLPEVKDLKLSRDTYVGIFLGKITKWNDPAVAKDNSDEKLPDLPINVAFRSDGSGTTFVFTKHLSAISADFADEVGTDKSVTWPVGAGGKGNEGVTALIKQTPGTVGYVEYGYAVHNKLSMASLQNKSGKFVKPTDQSGAATLAHVEFPENLRIWPEDPTGDDDYPIATFTWLLLYKKYSDSAKLQALQGFVTYGLTDGQKFAGELGYIPLPAGVVEKSKAALASIQ
jgi:phosphate transport system substrate-binding protein